MNDTTPKVNTWPTAYVVSCLPESNPRHRHFSLRVEWRGADQWCVTDGIGCLNIDGEWSYEPIPSERVDEWKARHRFILSTALRLARGAAPHITVNGITVADALARSARRVGG